VITPALIHPAWLPDNSQICMKWGSSAGKANTPSMPATSATHRHTTSTTGCVLPPAGGWGIFFSVCESVMVIVLSRPSFYSARNLVKHKMCGYFFRHGLNGKVLFLDQPGLRGYNLV
jgi:hypothetical protein